MTDARIRTLREVSPTTPTLWPVSVGAPIIAARMIEELVADMNACTVPETVATFSELHDYVDANMYAFDFIEACPMLPHDIDTLIEYLNAAMTIVDNYLVELRRQVLAKQGAAVATTERGASV